jgi:hypothetical protein
MRFLKKHGIQPGQRQRRLQTRLQTHTPPGRLANIAEIGGRRQRAADFSFHAAIQRRAARLRLFFVMQEVSYDGSGYLQLNT